MTRRTQRRALAGTMLAALPLALAAAPPPGKPVLVPDLSERRIEIAYSFTGVDLLLFGAILYPGGRLPNDRAPTDVVVVVRGPTRAILVREKARVAGIWVNANRLRYESAPSFYAIASSRPIAALLDQRTRAIYELGLDSLQLSPASSAPADVQGRFQHGLVALMQRRGLYVEAPGAVSIADGVLYRGRVAIPAQVPVGRFTAETFLVRDGHVLAAAVRGFDVRKSGFERNVARAAVRFGWLYGLAAIAMSVVLGWTAGWIARRL